MIAQPPPVEFPGFVDSSMLAAYKACPRSFYYRYLRSLASVERSVHLVAGAAFAKGLEVARTAFWMEGKPHEEALHEASIALLEEYGDFEIIEADQSRIFKTPENVLLALHEYFEHYGWENDHIQPFWPEGSEKPAVEFTFSLPLPINHPVTGEPMLYTGRYDMIGCFQQALFAVDEKTTSRLGPSWTSQWTLRSQFIGYAWAAQQYGYPVAGAIVRGMSFLKERFDHAQVILHYPPHLIETWYDNMLATTRLMIADWNEGMWRQVFDNACSNYGACNYLQLCNKTNPEAWVATNYYKREWNPLKNF